MAKVTILLSAAPDTSGHPRFAFELAKAAVARGHEAVLFGLGDGAYLADVRRSEGRQAGIVKELRAYLEAQLEAGEAGEGMGKLEVLTCSLSAQERGLRAEDLIPGSRISSTVQLGRLMSESGASLFLVP